MLSVMGGNYLIVGEKEVQWMPSATKIPDEKEPKAVHPVWLMDSLGIRAAVFVRCPTCQNPLGFSPSDATEQKEWNQKEPELTNIVGCARCSNLWMLTNDKAYHLMVLPPQSEHTPRILTAPPKGGKA